MQSMEVPLYKLFALSKVQKQILNVLVNSDVHFHFFTTSSQPESLKKKISDIKQQSLALAYSRLGFYNYSFKIDERNINNFEGTLPPLKDLARPLLEMQEQDIDFFIYLIIPAYTNYFSNSFFFDEFYDFIDHLFSISNEQKDTNKEKSNLKKILKCCSCVFHTFEMNLLFNSTWFPNFWNYYSNHIIEGENREKNYKDSNQEEQKNFLRLLLDLLNQKSSSIPEYVFKIIEKLNQKNLAFEFIKEYFLVQLFTDPSSFFVLYYYQNSSFVEDLFEPIRRSIDTELVNQFLIFFSHKIEDTNRKTIYINNRQNNSEKKINSFNFIPEFNIRIFSKEEIDFIGKYTNKNYNILKGFYIEQKTTNEFPLSRNPSLPISTDHPEKKALGNILKYSSPFSIPCVFPINYSDFMDDIMSSNENNLPPELKTKIDLKKFLLNQIQRSRKEKQPILFSSFLEIEKIFEYINSNTGKQISEDNLYNHDHDQMRADSLQTLSQTMDHFCSLIKKTCFNLKLSCFNVIDRMKSESHLRINLNSKKSDPKGLLKIFQDFLDEVKKKNDELLKSFNQKLITETVFHLVYRHISYKQFKANHPDLLVLDKYIQEVHKDQFFKTIQFKNLSPYAEQITKFHELMMIEGDPLQKCMDIHNFMISIVKEKEKMLEARRILSEELIPLINPPEIASCVNYIDKFLFPDGNLIDENLIDEFNFSVKPSVPLHLLYVGLETFVLQPGKDINVLIYGEKSDIQMMKKIFKIGDTDKFYIVLASNDFSSYSKNRPIKFNINISNMQRKSPIEKGLSFQVTKFSRELENKDGNFIVVPGHEGDPIPNLSENLRPKFMTKIKDFESRLLELGI